MPKAESKVKWTFRGDLKRRWGAIFEAEKGSSYSRDTDSSLKVMKMRVGKRNQATKSVFFSGSSPYATAMLYERTKYQRREWEPENETGKRGGPGQC